MAVAGLGFDFHNHLLAGVDDGIKTYEETRCAIAGLKALGFQGAVITPHIYGGVFDNSTASLREQFSRLRGALADDGVRFELVLAAEYFADEHLLSLIEADDLLFVPVSGERWVLLEFPFLQESPFATACLSALVTRGYRPVVAHVERYPYVAAALPLWLDRFAVNQAVLQANIGSLVGQNGKTVQDFAMALYASGVITLWGTDLHRPQQISQYIAPGLAKLRTTKQGRKVPLNFELEALLPPRLTEHAA